MLNRYLFTTQLVHWWLCLFSSEYHWCYIHIFAKHFCFKYVQIIFSVFVKIVAALLVKQIIFSKYGGLKLVFHMYTFVR